MFAKRRKSIKSGDKSRHVNLRCPSTRLRQYTWIGSQDRVAPHCRRVWQYFGICMYALGHVWFIFTWNHTHVEQSGDCSDRHLVHNIVQLYGCWFLTGMCVWLQSSGKYFTRFWSSPKQRYTQSTTNRTVMTRWSERIEDWSTRYAVCVTLWEQIGARI